MRLTYQNNWCADTYFVDKKPISDLKKIRIDDKEYNVISRMVAVSYNDMGHTYEGISTHFFVKTKVLGVMQEIDLNTIVPFKKVSALKYTLA